MIGPRPNSPDHQEIRHRFSYHPPKPEQVELFEELRREAMNFAMLVIEHTPQGREQALALTKIEEAVMHANSAIARRS